LIPKSARLESLFQSFGAFSVSPIVRSSGDFRLQLYRSFLEISVEQIDSEIWAEFRCRAVTGDPADRKPHNRVGIDTPIEDRWFTRWAAQPDRDGKE
jgi:hypothetical protein